MHQKRKDIPRHADRLPDHDRMLFQARGMRDRGICPTLKHDRIEVIFPHLSLRCSPASAWDASEEEEDLAIEFPCCFGLEEHLLNAQLGHSCGDRPFHFIPFAEADHGRGDG